VQRKLAITDNNSVTRVVSTLIANAVINSTAEQIGRLTLAFVSPLSTN
jgi:hypothetical protein